MKVTCFSSLPLPNFTATFYAESPAGIVYNFTSKLPKKKCFYNEYLTIILQIYLFIIPLPPHFFLDSFSYWRRATSRVDLWRVNFWGSVSLKKFTFVLHFDNGLAKCRVIALKVFSCRIRCVISLFSCIQCCFWEVCCLALRIFLNPCFSGLIIKIKGCEYMCAFIFCCSEELFQ